MNVFSLVLLLTSITCQLEGKSDDDREGNQSDHKWTRCYDELGCVNNTDDWYHPILRPLKEQPLERHIIKTTFTLFQKGMDSKHLVNMEPIEPIYKGIKISSFDKRLKTHLLIHDFTSNGLAGWVKHAVKSLLAANFGNVISVDWTGGAEPPYAIAVQNARVVALEIVYLMKIFLNDFGMRPEQFHLIGHGVGAHIAGYVGQKIGNVGRITGLDPNGLYFSDLPCFARLDPEDAKFVDIIHTDIAKNHGQGSGEPYGHLNFYPNGGYTQPGCNASSLYPHLNDITRDMLREGEVAPGCNHKRATKYFTASMDEEHECTMMGYLCADYMAFERGECLECQLGYTCAPLGYPAITVAANLSTPLATKLFLDTAGSRPFCMYAYKVIVTLVPGEVTAQDAPTSTSSEGGTVGMFCATIYSDAERIMFRTNLNMGVAQKPLLSNGDNVFMTFQKGPKMTQPNKVVLHFDSEQSSTVVYVTQVRVILLPGSGRHVTPLCGGHEVTKFIPRTEAEFTACSKVAVCKNVKRGYPTRQRRNPEESAPSGGESLEYDEDELPSSEDDYYSNR